MGTSQSKRDGGPGRPLVPAWADQDPAAPAPGEAPAPQAQPANPPAPSEVTAARRLTPFRVALGQYAATGSSGSARAALGHWARTGSGGTRATVSRVARAARTGGAALAGVSRAASGLAPVDGGLDVRSLAGQPVQAAIDRIVDAFCPAGILDEEIARTAIGEALAEAMGDADVFDPDAISARTVEVATLTFAAELVFLQVAGEAGQALAKAPSPAAAVQREADLRALVREVADVVGTPIIQAAGNVLTAAAMGSLVSRLVQAVSAEIATW